MLLISSSRVSFEATVYAMYDIITELQCVDETETKTVSVEADDLPNLLYHFMDECLFLFNADYFCAKSVVITEFTHNTIQATLYVICLLSLICSRGETFIHGKHPQGIEIKAITYSNMEIRQQQDAGAVDVFVIVDI